MSTVIGTVTLDEDMAWTDEFSYPLISASAERTVGGGVYVQEYERVESGRPVTLESGETFGLQKRSTITSLQTLANVAWATYTLTITSSNGQTFTRTVRFRNEEGPLQFDPLQARDGIHDGDGWYKGKIMLMVI